jgi:hypothetical protein
MRSKTQLPPRALPVLYIGVAHVALVLAFAAVAVDPRGVAGFFYHSRMLAIVHLVTLGWITSSILGSLYIVGPIALRLHLPATWRGYTAFGLVAIGVVGMVSHFWIEEYPGMAWSAATVGAGIMLAGSQVLWRLRDSQLAAPVAVHIVLAFANLVGAATLGILIGFDKVYHFLPGTSLFNVFAHAHLAAVGWASMMVVGISYRLVPMVLPAQMPAGPRLWLTSVLLESGIVLLFVTLLVRGSYTWIPAVAIVAGFGVFLSTFAWMLRHPRSVIVHIAGDCVGVGAVARDRGSVDHEPSCRDGVWRLRARRVSRAAGRRHGRPPAAVVRVVLGLRQRQLQRAGAITARDGVAPGSGAGVRALAVRRAGVGRRAGL